jgi:conjugal transfer ATP-binding protein TraC
MDKLFSVFDLYTLSASGNKRIINAQMFLILKFIENEVRQNKNRNQNKVEKQKILIVVDEAHLLIDKQMPVALNFMFQMVKRIRKYDGAIIVTTQNINDFIGDDEIKRQSTAIINNCQYSLIFQLKSGDLNDLNELLSGSAQLSEREEEALTVLDKGTCLFSISNQNRFLLKIKGTDEEKELFKT